MTTQYIRYPSVGSSSSGIPTYANFGSLPSSAADGSVAVTLDTDTLYVYNLATTTWLPVGSPSTVLSIGTIDSQSKSANGAVIASNSLVFQTADGAHPGLLSIAAQTIAGAKTFTGSIVPTGGIDTASAGTIAIGTLNATAINIGNAGCTVNIQGTVITETTSVLNVTNPVFTVNSAGSAGSASNSGMQVEENGVITGYSETSADRNSWIFKAPNTAGVATITPGASGITLNQSSHNPVTLGTANGLSLSTQVLSLAAASTSTTGALTSADWNTFNGKQAAGSYLTDLTGDGTASGPGSAVFTLATVNASPGLIGDPSHFTAIQVNAKGLITAANSGLIGIAESQVTNLVSDLAGKQAGPLTGDVTTSGAAATLATVNSNVGSFGSSTLIPAFTVNAKGLITAASTNAVSVPNPGIVAKTANYTLTAADSTVTGSGAAFTLTLPAASGNSGKQYTIQKTDSSFSNVITVSDGAGFSTTLNTISETIFIQSNGSTYFLLSRTFDEAWNSFTCALTGFGTVGSQSFWWKRTGGGLVLKGYFTSGSSTGVAAKAALPSGLTFDTTKGADSPTQGMGLYTVQNKDTTQNVISTFGGVVFTDGSDTSELFFGQNSTAGGQSSIGKANGSSVAGAGYGVSIVNAFVPISGWN